MTQLDVSTNQPRPQGVNLPVSGEVRSDVLLRDAASAYARGLLRHGDDLVAAVLGTAQHSAAGTLGAVLQRAFGRTEEIDHIVPSWAYARSVEILVKWRQPAAAFCVLASAPAGEWAGAEIITDHGGSRACGVDMLDGLWALRSGSLSMSLVALHDSAERMHCAGQHGAGAVADVLVAEVATCLGHASVARRSLDRIRDHRHHLGRSNPWSVRAESVVALRAAQAGRYEGGPIERTNSAGLVSIRRVERDRAELVIAVACVSSERWHEAYEVLGELINRTQRGAHETIAWGLLSHFADAAVHLGRIGEARAALSLLDRVEGLFECDIALAELLFATALLGDDTHADVSYEVLLSHDLSRWPWLAARARLARGQYLRRRRRVTEARTHILAAQRLFVALEAPAWQRRAAAELRAAGVRGGLDCDASPALPLSPQERQIAMLAARGLTNRAIGEILYMSPRTVGSHLYRMFPKLNITSRNQLSALHDSFGCLTERC